MSIEVTELRRLPITTLVLPVLISLLAAHWIGLNLPAEKLGDSQASDAADGPPDWMVAIPDDPARVDFAEHALPAIEWYCLSCHDQTNRKGGVVLEDVEDEQEMMRQFRDWEKVVDQLENRTMPPDRSDQPDEVTRQRLAKFLRHVLDTYEPEGPPDPGPALLRRLTHLEYNNTVRDLTGVDMQPAQRFPAGGGGGEGFSNNAATLFLSPLLIEKYLDASQRIIQHLEVSFTRGLVWHEASLGDRPRQAWRLQAEEDLKQYRFELLDKLEVFEDDTAQIQRFLPALYRYHHAQLSDESLTVDAFARANNLDAIYLTKLDTFLDSEPSEDDTPIARVISYWRELPPPQADRTIEEQDLLSNEAAAEMAELMRKNSKEVARWFLTGEDKRSFVLQAGHRRLQRNPFSYDESQLRAVTTEAQRTILDRLETEERLRRAADAQHERALMRSVLADFVRRAYRRPTNQAELDQLLSFFDQVREESSSFEQAARQTIRRVLISPHLLFRVERDPPGDQPAGISDIELASRLSYLIWASMPDETLLSAAEAGELQDDESLQHQVRRMLADEKSAGLADQLLGQWLGLEEVARTDGPDVEVFPAYGDSLRDDFVAEARRFLVSLIREDQPTLAMINADYTFANAQLSKHYGLSTDPQNDEHPDEWKRVSVREAQRGGLLGMGAFHLLTSYPTRSSPVLRGQWVLGTLLGSPAPPPPPNVGELAEGEHVESLSLRERLMAHRANASCAVCHDRLDPVGFAMQRFDAIGRWVQVDSAGQPVDDRGVMPDGTELDGVGGLRDYLLKQRERFYRQISRKTLGYALGRELQYYDRPTLRRMEARLMEDDRFSTLIIEVARSYPFQYRRPGMEVDTTTSE